VTYDHAQDPRLGQHSGMENPGIRLVYTEDLPEVAYKGQLIYNADTDLLSVHDGVAWQPIGDSSASRTFVSTADPAATPSNAVVDGDIWLDPADGYLQVWVDGTGWVDPSLLPDSVGDEELQEDAITFKHTIYGSQIIGSVFYTADPELYSTYIQMNQDANGGIIYFVYGIGETFRGFINPRNEAGRPMLHFSSGTEFANGTGSCQLKMYGAYDTGAGKKAELNSDLYIEGKAFIATTGTTGLGTTLVLHEGEVKRVSSALKYKRDVELLPYTKAELLKLRPVTFGFRAEPGQGVGFIADEADELGLDAWVITEDGEVESFRYAEWSAALQQICIEQQHEIDDLTARLERLEALVGQDEA
jgi:hypothetical protein